MTEFDPISVLLGAVVGAGFGGGVAWMVLRAGAIGTQREAARAATALLEKAEAEAKAKAKDLELEAERKSRSVANHLMPMRNDSSKNCVKLKAVWTAGPKSWMLDPRRSPTKKSKRKLW